MKSDASQKCSVSTGHQAAIFFNPSRWQITAERRSNIRVHGHTISQDCILLEYDVLYFYRYATGYWCLTLKT